MASVKAELDGTNGVIEQYDQKLRDIEASLEERKDTLQQLGDELARLKKEQGERTEERK